MNRNKGKYFTVTDLKKIEKGCTWLFLIGERANGKSYSVKSKVLKDAFNSIDGKTCKKQFAYIRRFDRDCKDSICEPYFADMPITEITSGLYTMISVYRKRIYFANIDETGKVIRGVCIGQCFALSSAEHYKSLMFPNIYTIIYEEVISQDSKYLYQEPHALQQLISTILRDRGTEEGAKVYLIGNTLSRHCPYYNDFGLTNVEKLEMGQSNIYHIDNTVLKVYRTYSRNYNSGMFFGNASKNITKGEYYTEEQPHLKGKIQDYNICHTVVLKYENLKYLLRFLKHKTDNFYVWYIEPKTTPIQDDSRVIALEYNSSLKWTHGFLPLTRNEETAFNMLTKYKKMVFSDNLTGTEFKNILTYFI